MRTGSAISLLMIAATLTSVAQNRTTATQTLHLEVRPIALISVTGDPQPLRVTNGGPGIASLDPVEERSTSYSLTTNASNMKLSVSIDEPVPQGTRLYVELDGATGTSAGTIDISEAVSPLDAVTGISKGIVTNQGIYYRFEADADAAAFPTQVRKVILTLTD